MTQKQLTREQVLKAKPGDYLDRMVAINVMGFEPSNQRSGWVRVGALATYPKRYSTDISAAWEVIDKMIYFGMEVNVGFYEKWDCALDYRGTNWCAQADRAPEAICKAALLAVLDL